ncbi:TetR/AcrR family transcriptional regulator [Microbacterium sp. NPDC057650]|uniref:TetR/AcrR family transcriptional regulator n=1 Tax=unclassified Microbacterium TaxID=2609290 RepID=UPI00366B429A
MRQNMAATHPNALRSRRLLADALVELLVRRPFREITVGEIADRAQVARRTFYRHFTAKEDLLAEHLRMLAAEYIDDVRPVVELPTAEIVRVHLGFWRRHLPLLRALQRDGMQYLLVEGYSAHIAEVRAGSGSRRYAQLARDEYALAFNAGGHLNVLFEWLRRGAEESPESVARSLGRLRGPDGT